VQYFCIYSILITKLFRGADNKFFFLVDNPADVIGNPSGGKRGVWASLENDDIQLGAAALCLRGGAHSRSITADDYQSFFDHDDSSPITTVLSTLA
jgi:hypothetical protein